jgi:hypothetical protein
MYALSKLPGRDAFSVVVVQPFDVEFLFRQNVALFHQELHAEYANSVLGKMEAPLWQQNYDRYGKILHIREPYFIPHSMAEFTNEWLRVMVHEARTRLSRYGFSPQQTTFMMDIQKPAVTPWYILKLENEHVVVDKNGRVIAAKSTERVNELSSVTFIEELWGVSGVHLEFVDTSALKKVKV